MERTQQIIADFFPASTDQMVIGGCSLSELLETVDTPAYVYDFEILNKSYTLLREGLPDDLALFYSMKANPSLAICSRFNTLGSGVEIGSLGEMKIALQAGFSADKIIYAGPGKRYDELEEAIDYNILSINIESREELLQIIDIGKKKNTKANVSIRINPKVNITGSQLRMGGGPLPFGIDEEKKEEILDLILANRQYINFQGLHVYVGNQIFDYTLSLKNIRNTIQIAREIASYVPEQKISYVNLGGGLGIPYYKKDTYFDRQSFQTELTALLKEVKQEKCFSQTVFIMELGRYLTACSGVFLTKVVTTKESRGRNYIVLDGGMNYCSIGTGNLGQKIQKKFPLCVANKLQENLDRTASIVGPLCTPMDSFGNDFAVPQVKPGDTIAVLFVGAYGYSTSPHYFLTHCGCGEAAAENGKITVVRDKLSLEQRKV